MNALTTGGLIFLYLLVSQSMAAYIESQTAPDFTVGDCHINVTNNTTVCETISGPTFIDSLQTVTITGLNGAPEVFNGFWIGIHVFLLALATALVLGWFVGLFFGGAS